MKNFYRPLLFLPVLFAPVFMIGCETADVASPKTENSTSTDSSSGDGTAAAEKTESGATTADSITLNSENTTVLFTGAHKDEAKDDRVGFFSSIEGKAVTDGGKLTALDLTINTDSITIKPAESSLDEAMAGKLKDHLSNADFFNTSQFPTAKFVLNKATEEDGKMVLTGNLTLLETTKEVTIPAVVTTDGGLKIEGATEIDRTEFGMDYGLDDIVETVKLEIKVDTTK